MKVTLIAAIAENGVIGKDNDLIWHLSDDLKRFKQLTKGHHVIMGRKTFESLGRPLPNRVNIVVSRNANYKAEGAIVVDSLKEALYKAEGDAQPFIIGGGAIYKQALGLAQTMELTKVHHAFEGDTYFPEFDENTWELVFKEHHPKDEKHQYSFDFLRYERG